MVALADSAELRAIHDHSGEERGQFLEGGRSTESTRANFMSAVACATIAEPPERPLSPRSPPAGTLGPPYTLIRKRKICGGKP